MGWEKSGLGFNLKVQAYGALLKRKEHGELVTHQQPALMESPEGVIVIQDLADILKMCLHPKPSGRLCQVMMCSVYMNEKDYDDYNKHYLFDPPKINVIFQHNKKLEVESI